MADLLNTVTSWLADIFAPVKGLFDMIKYVFDGFLAIIRYVIDLLGGL